MPKHESTAIQSTLPVDVGASTGSPKATTGKFNRTEVLAFLANTTPWQFSLDGPSPAVSVQIKGLRSASDRFWLWPESN